MRGILEFGDEVDGYVVRVLNERAVRASAGLLFLVAIISFMNAWLMGNFQPIRVFVVVFLIEFSIRIFINPLYAPVMILGQWIVRKQQPEYAGAPQKRFAWTIAFVLALIMMYLVVLNNVIGPFNLIVCLTCLTLLFFEAAFGICLACKIYNLFHKEKAQSCPGGVCEVAPNQGSGGSFVQIVMLILFAVSVGVVAQWIYHTAPQNLHQVQQLGTATSTTPIDPAEAERCKVPDYAKAMGHEEQWKLHNNCK